MQMPDPMAETAMDALEGLDTDQVRIFQQLKEYDAADDRDGLSAYVQSLARAPAAFEIFAEYFLRHGRFIPAFLTGSMMITDPDCGPIAALAYGIGELAAKTIDAPLQGPSILSDRIDPLSDPAKNALYHAKIDPIFRAIISFEPRAADFRNRWRLGLLNLIKASSPSFRQIFDFTNLDDLHLPLSDLITCGAAKADLISIKGYDRPQDLPARKAVIALRARVNPLDPQSRPLTEGARLLQACRSAGWTALSLGLYETPGEDVYFRILQHVLDTGADILILDEDFMQTSWRDASLRMIELIKTQLPDLKLVGFIFDPWRLGDAAAQAWIDTYDLFWSLSPDFLSHNRAFTRKGFFAPFPHGGDYSGPAQPLKSRVSFAGSISAFNWHRTLWRTAIEAFALPVDFRLTGHQSDGLPIMESYLEYMRAIGDSTVSINFSMRHDLSRSITGRTFETLASGALLIQETCPELDRYLIQGRHYLPFTTFRDLCGVIDFVKNKPSQAQDIRHNGTVFMREVYSDQKIIEYLDRKLFPH